MKSLEHWVLRIADCNATWIGFGWLRPAKQQHIGFGYILFSSVLLGLPGVAVGAGLIYWFVGRVEPRVWLHRSARADYQLVALKTVLRVCKDSDGHFSSVGSAAEL